MRGLCKTHCGCMIEYEPHEFSDGFVYYLPRNLDKTIHECAVFQMFEELYDNPDPNLEEMYEENKSRLQITKKQFIELSWITPVNDRFNNN